VPVNPGSALGMLSQGPGGITAQPVRQSAVQQAGLPPGFVLDQQAAALPPGFVLDQPNAPGLVQGGVRAAASGIPIVGPLLNKADAATDALLAPVLNGLYPEEQQLHGTFGERYQKALDTQNQMDTAFQQQHPVVSGGAQVAGGVASMLPLAGTGIGARLLGLTGSLPRQMAVGAASGAALNAADAALRGNDPLQGAEEGAAFGAAGPVVGRAVGRAVGAFGPNMRNYATAARGADQDAIDAVADRQYDSALNSNVTFRGPTRAIRMVNGLPQTVTLPGATQILAQQSVTNLLREGFRQSDAPAIFDMLQERMTAPGPTSYGDVMAMYRQLNKRISMTNNNMERAAAGMVKTDLRNFLDNPPANDVLSGNAQQAAADFRTANANYSAARGSETIQEKIDQALNQAGGAYSGMNVENSLRQKIKTIINSPKLSRGFQPDEIAAMQDFVRSGAGNLADYLRTAGNLMQGGGGLGAQMEVYAALMSGHPLGLAVPIAGRGIRMLGNVLANRGAENLAAQARLRAPAAAQARGDYVAAAARNAALAHRARVAGNLAVRSTQPLLTQQPVYPGGQ
jgi:hypothetical protein